MAPHLGRPSGILASATMLAALAACSPRPAAVVGLAIPGSEPLAAVNLVRELAIRHEGGEWPQIKQVGSTGLLSREAEAAHNLVDDPAVAIVIGHAGSRATLVGATAYNALGVPHLSHNATSTLVERAGPWTHLLMPSDTAMASVVTAWAHDSVGASSVAVFHLADEAGRSVAAALTAAGNDRGVAMHDVPLPSFGCSPSGASSHRPILDVAMARWRPDALVLAVPSPLLRCLVLLAGASWENLPLVSTDAITWQDAAIRTLAPEVRARLRIVDLGGGDRSHPWREEIVRRFTAARGHPPADADLLLMDSYLVAGRAIREAGASRRSVQAWLARHTDPGTAVRGLTGPITFPRQARLFLTPEPR